MITNELQERIRRGERAAFETLYKEHAKTVYASAWSALNDRQAALAVVKQTFLTLRDELTQSDADVDIDQRIQALSNREIDLQQAFLGVFSEGTPAAEANAAPAAQAPSAPQPRAPQSAPPAAVQASSPLERVQERMAADGAPVHDKRTRRPRRADAPPRESNGVVTALIFVFLALFIWIAVGILMDLGILTRIDLGFAWFNDNIFPLFQL